MNARVFESSVKLVWSPMILARMPSKAAFESSVKLVWSPIVELDSKIVEPV